MTRWEGRARGPRAEGHSVRSPGTRVSPHPGSASTVVTPNPDPIHFFKSRSNEEKCCTPTNPTAVLQGIPTSRHPLWFDSCFDFIFPSHSILPFWPVVDCTPGSRGSHYTQQWSVCSGICEDVDFVTSDSWQDSVGSVTPLTVKVPARNLGFSQRAKWIKSTSWLNPLQTAAPSCCDNKQIEMSVPASSESQIILCFGNKLIP